MNNKLLYTVRVSEPNLGLTNLMLDQLRGPAASWQRDALVHARLSEDDPGRKDMLLHCREELSHLAIVSSIVAMLNKGAKGRPAALAEEQADLYAMITRDGNDGHTTQVSWVPEFTVDTASSEPQGSPPTPPPASDPTPSPDPSPVPDPKPRRGPDGPPPVPGVIPPRPPPA